MWIHWKMHGKARKWLGNYEISWNIDAFEAFFLLDLPRLRRFIYKKSSLGVGNSADLGHALGDGLEDELRWRAVLIFTAGFWLLDASRRGASRLSYTLRQRTIVSHIEYNRCILI